MSNPAFGCCCSSPNCVKDCIFNTEIESGCCHKTDTLVLWNKRPTFTVNQHYLVGGLFGGTDCEVCFTKVCPDMQPVQSIYKFHDCYWRVDYPSPAGAISLITMPNGDGVFCGEGCANPDCFPAYSNGCSTCGDVCCGTQIPSFPNNCLYNTWFGAGIGGLSNWRRDTLWNDDATKWFIEQVGHKNNQPLGGTNSVGSLYNQMVFIVYHEKWWKIAEDCSPSTRIYVPGCQQGVGDPPSSNCGGIPFVESDLVPKWWIFACSGIPIYQFEIDEALELGVIDSGDYTSLMASIAIKAQPDQAIMKKLAAGGYTVAKDWRAEQRTAYVELHKKFPNAGYNNCIEPCENMHTLGPFRKRLTEETVGTSNVPLLHSDDVIPELDALQADCFLDYDGDQNSQEDYDFWRERQWVYFRGVPGGWTWAGWNNSCDPQKTEIENILDGCGRGVGIGGPELIEEPMLAFRGEPRGQCPCYTCPPQCTNQGFVYCNNCTTDCESTCGIAPIAACNPPSVCRRFIIAPECEGVRFVASAYQWQNDVDQNCTNVGEYKCLWSVESFLTTAQRSVDSWDANCPYTCNGQFPPLGAFNNWDAIANGTLGEENMCSDLIDPNSNIYRVEDLCCGAYCIDYDYNNCSGYPCAVQGPNLPCPATDECPPHGSGQQIGCIGHSINCLSDNP